MYDIKPVRHVRRCRCGARVVVVSTIGPSNICDRCADNLLAVIWGERWPALKAHLDGLGKFTYPGADVPAGRKASRPQNRRRAARYP